MLGRSCLPYRRTLTSFGAVAGMAWRGEDSELIAKQYVGSRPSRSWRVVQVLLGGELYHSISMTPLRMYRAGPGFRNFENEMHLETGSLSLRVSYCEIILECVLLPIQTLDSFFPEDIQKIFPNTTLVP